VKVNPLDIFFILTPHVDLYYLTRCPFFPEDLITINTQTAVSITAQGVCGFHRSTPWLGLDCNENIDWCKLL
jgi:hypothetical protein